MDQLNLFQDGPGIPMLEEGEGIKALNSLQTKTAAEADQVERIAAPQPTQEQEQPSGEIAGKGGPERTIGTGGDAVGGIASAIDGVLGTDISGLLESNREAAQPEKEKLEKAADDFKKNQPEPVKVVSGGIRGAAESALGAAEIVGDTAKTFATLGNVAGKDNVFSNEYEWAKWNLGKDEYGAQTGVGKIAQGFVEFGSIAALTGGFGGVTGAGAKVAGASTKLGKAGQIAKVGAVEGLYGVAADMVMASKGEGNMANLIAENIPGLKDTFITALAIDEDDNPWEAAFKTALDGFGLGAIVGSAGAYIAGARAAKKAIAGGATEEAAGEAAAQAAAEVIQATKPTPSSNTSKVAQSILGSGNTERFERFSQIQDLQSKGIPTTWDDAAAVVPEYFAKGNREVQADFAQSVYDQLDGLDPDGGLTVDPFTGEVPVSGTMVAIDGEVLEDLSQEAVADFISRNSDILSREDVYLGSWVSEKTGKPVVELSRLVEDGDEADMLGRMFDQEGVFRLDDFEYLSTDGSDALRQTKGQHLRSAYSVAQEPQVVPAQTAAKTQLQTAKSLDTPANGGGGQRTYTDAQIKQVADAQGEEVAQQLDNLVQSNPIDVADLVKTSRMTDGEINGMIEAGIEDFLDTAGKIDLNKIEKMGFGDDTILSKKGTVQTRFLIQNIASAVYDSAFKVNTNASEAMENSQHVSLMVDNLKALLRLHKRTAQVYGSGLAEYSRKVEWKDAPVDVSFTKVSADDMTKALDLAEKELDEMVVKLASFDEKATQQAQRTAAMLQLTGGDPTKLVDIAKNVGSLYSDAALKIMYNSLLSSPATHVVNATSNAFNTIYRPLTAWAGGDAKTKKAAMASFYGFDRTLRESLDLAFRTLKTGESGSQGSKILVQSSQFDVAFKEARRIADESGDFGQQAGIGFLQMLKYVADAPLFSWPSRLLSTSDEFFKNVVARMEYSRTMMDKAIADSGYELGKNDAAIDRAFQKLLKSEYSRNFTKTGGAILNQDLNTAAKEVTFQTELTGAAGKFAAFLNDTPALRPFFPFVKTGHNVLVYTGTHVPVLNLALEESRKVLLDPNADPYQKAVMQGRMGFGAMAMLAGGFAASNGLISGNGPSDPRRRKEWLRTHQPRSLKVGDKWVSFDRIEPIGPLLAVAADINYAVTSGQLEEDRAQYLVGYMANSIAVNLTDKSMFQGLSPLAELLNPRNQSPEAFISKITEISNNFTPLAGARRAFTNAMTPYMQEYNKLWDRTLATATFGALGNRADSIDWLTGEPITSASAGEWNAVMPWKVVERGTDVVKDALEDIEFDSAAVREELGDIDLTPEQKGVLAKYMADTGLHAELKKFVSKPSFNEKVDEYIQRLKEGHRVKKEDQFFYRHIKSTISRAQTIALARLRQDYPELDSEYRLGRAAQQMDRMPNGYEPLIRFNNK